MTLTDISIFQLIVLVIQPVHPFILSVGSVFWLWWCGPQGFPKKKERKMQWPCGEKFKQTQLLRETQPDVTLQ